MTVECTNQVLFVFASFRDEFSFFLDWMVSSSPKLRRKPRFRTR